MEAAALWISIGGFIATAGATSIAWWQAIVAMRRKVDAETARDEAIVAQKASAAALDEANRIAEDARDLLKAQDSRDTERHDVRWQAQWKSQEGKWFLINRGHDTALAVRLETNLPGIAVETQHEDEVSRNVGLFVQLPAEFVGTGDFPTVVWRVEWRTPFGNEKADSGVWPM